VRILEATDEHPAFNMWDDDASEFDCVVHLQYDYLGSLGWFVQSFFPPRLAWINAHRGRNQSSMIYLDVLGRFRM
jgi:hypothetical protein